MNDAANSGPANGTPDDLPAATVMMPRDGRATLSERVRSLRLPDRMNERPPQRSWLPWALCLCLAGTTGYFAYVAQSQVKTEPPSESEKSNLTAASSPTAVAASGNVILESKGYIIPAHQIQVSPKVGGMIMKLMIEEGMRVKKGQILAELETVDYQADHDRAAATVDGAWQRFMELYSGYREEEIKQARAEMEEAEAQRDQLKLEYQRTNRLQGDRALAQRDYEQAFSAFRAMDRRVERLRQAHHLMNEGARQERIQAAWAEVQQAEADHSKAKWRLDNCTIRAPISGTILTKKAEEGNIVNPIAFNISATLCDMADLSDLEVDLTIQERDIAKVLPGQKVKLRADAFPERVYEGIVSRLMPIADRAKGAIPVRAKVRVPKEEEGVFLKPDMGVLVSFMKPEK